MFRVRCRSVAGESPDGAGLGLGESIPEVKERYESEAEGQTMGSLQMRSACG